MTTTLPVRWEMPAMKPGYTIIDLSKTGNQTSWNFAADQDVMFIGATTTRTLDRMYITGGNNIAIIGGKFEPTVTGNSATIHLNGVRGNVYIEGVHIDHKNVGAYDGIGIAGAPGTRPNVFIQNTIIDNIKGTQNGVHGDMFQRYGQLGDVKMYNVSGSTNYQGLFLNPHPGYEIRSLELENIDIVKNPGGDARTWTYYFYSPGHNQAYPVKLTNVYTSDRNVFPPPGYAEGAIINGDIITFPNKAFTGHMTLGRPPGGDFVTADQIGIGYKHSGTLVGTTPPTQPGQPTQPTEPTKPTQPEPPKSDTLESSTSVDWLPEQFNNLTLTGSANLAGVGNAKANIILGNAGNNWLAGGGGADQIDGRGGVNWVNYQMSNAGVTVNLTTGTGQGGWAEGNTLKNIHNVRGSAHNDTLIGNAGNNILQGGGGHDVLDGRGGNNTLTGGAGNDVFVLTRGGSNTITDFEGGPGLGDRIDVSAYGFTSLSQITARATQSGANTVITLGNGDTLTLQNFARTSLAADDFIFAAPPPPPPVSDTLQSAVSVDWLPEQFNNLTLTGSANIAGVGNAKANVILGNAGNNWLAGGGGADSFDGRGGVNWVNYQASNAAVTVNLSTGTGQGGWAEGNTLKNIQNLRGSAHNDTLIGNAGNNILQGGGGNDVLDGRGGNNTLTGGAGNDIFVLSRGGSNTITDFEGGPGLGDRMDVSAYGFTSLSQMTARATQSGANTVINLGNGDTVTLLNFARTSLAADDFIFAAPPPPPPPAAAPATMTSATSVAWLPEQFDNLTLTGSANLSGVGNAKANVILGNAGNNWLAGGGGADSFDGRGGVNWVNYEGSNAGVFVNLTTGLGKGGWAEGNTLKNIQNLRGSAHNDTLVGDAGNNILQGGRGNDYLEGGAGNDILTGGPGNDVFAFWRGSGHDIITDFEGGPGLGDVIRLSGFGVTSFNQVRGLMTQQGADTVINLGQGDSIRLLNVSALSLAADDFQFA